MFRLLVLMLSLWFPLTVCAAGTILVFGDSISAGYGLPQDAGWVRLLAQRVAGEAPGYRVVNASISGETAVGGRRRIAHALDQHRPEVVILELGGNDGLRGTPIEAIQTDIEAMVETAVQRKAKVVLVGMRLPPNYGTAYVQRFQSTYATIAKKYALPFVPFLFEGFGERQELFQGDGIHPTRAAQTLMLETVWKTLAPLINARSVSPARK